MIELVHVEGDELETIQKQAYQAASEVCEAAKLKEGDFISQSFESTNKTELVFFSDKAQAYKSRASAFDDTKASVMGDYIPAKLSFDEGESLKIVVPTVDYSGYVIFFFENGKAAKVPLKSYETKTNHKKLAKAYSEKEQAAA